MHYLSIIQCVCLCVCVCTHAQWSHHLMFVMIRDGLFNSTSPHVGIHLRPLSGVNGVFARLALKVFEDTRPDVMCIQPPALLLLIDLLCFCLFSACFCCFSLFCHIFSNLNESLVEISCQFSVCIFRKLPLHITASIKQHRCFPFF